MKPDKVPFPKKIYHDLVWRLSKSSFLIVVGVLTALYWEFFIEVGARPDRASDLDTLFKLLASHTLFIAAALVALYMWVGRRFVRPIRGLWSALTNFAAGAEASENPATVNPEIYHQEIGEWSTINETLNRLERRIQHERCHHQREKDEVRTIMDSVSNAIIAVDRDLHVLFFNDNVPKLFGTGLRPDRDSYLTDLIRTPEVLALFRRVLAEGKVVVEDVEMSLGARASRGFFSVAVAPLKRGSERGVYGAVGIIHDISGLKQNERMRIEFVANASHELRAPLALVQSHLQMLKEELASGELKQAEPILALATHHLGRLQNLVGDLLDLSAIEAGAVLRCKELAPVPLTQEVLARRLVAEQRERVRVSSQVKTVYADPLRLNQVLSHLLDNALKYTPVDTPIEVDWQPAVNGVRLVIRDYGKGIAREHLARIFERFYRVDEKHSKAQGGTGLGLAIVKHIMLRHGGEVEVTSEEGRGATFSCFFPSHET